MTEFDPEVAYRILAEKQRRLYDEAYRHLRNQIVAQMEGHWHDAVWNWHQAMYDFASSEADKMWDVLEYLRERICEENQ